jgi:hypothetical protein
VSSTRNSAVAIARASSSTQAVIRLVPDNVNLRLQRVAEQVAIPATAHLGSIVLTR